MAMQTFLGRGTRMPSLPFISGLTFSSSVIDATGEKFAWIGRVWTPTRGAKSIRKVGFLFGTVTKAGGSALTISLQDVDMANNPPRPDETQDQTVAIANADANFVGGGWYQTGAFSADRSVNHGDLLAVVAEYDGAGRLGSDVVNFRNPANTNFGGTGQHFPTVSLKTASWATAGGIANIILEFSDGTFGTLLGGFPASNFATATFKQDTPGADEYALEFTVVAPMTIEGLWMIGGCAGSNADFDVVLYQGTTSLASVSFEGNHNVSPAEDRLIEFPFTSTVDLVTGTTYRVSVKPTQTTATARLTYFDVAAAGHMNVHEWGSNALFTSRIDLGSFAATTATRRPLIGPIVCGWSDGAGGGGEGWGVGSF